MSAESLREFGDMRRIERFPHHAFTASGAIISFTKRKPFPMKGMPVGRYLAAQLLRRDKTQERIYVHRAIAEAFFGPCPDGMQCRHLDGNPRNNAVENLAWGTPEENHADKVAHGTVSFGEKNPHSKLTADDVLRMRRIRRQSGISYAAIAGLFNVSTMTAFRAVTGKSWRTI